MFLNTWFQVGRGEGEDEGNSPSFYPLVQQCLLDDDSAHGVANQDDFPLTAPIVQPQNVVNGADEKIGLGEDVVEVKGGQLLYDKNDSSLIFKKNFKNGLH